MGTGLRRILSCLLVLAAAFCYASSSGQDGDERRVLVIPVQFRDVSFSHSVQELEQYVSNSCKYFDDQFRGGFKLVFEMAPIVNLPHEESFYGANGPDGEDVNQDQMLIDACTLLDESVALSDFDNDGDGVVEHLVILFSGQSESEGGHPDCIWANCHKLSDKHHSFSRDGADVDTFCCTSELGSADSEGECHIAGIGLFCHEFLHSFGLPDFYDTEFSGIQAYYSAGLWETTSIMDRGFRNNGGDCPPFLNCIEREMLGIGSAIPIEGGEIRLKPVQEGEWLRFDSDNPGEYYLMEYRNGQSWDSHIGGHGLLIYHIDRSSNASGEISGREVSAGARWDHNLVNGNPLHQCADLVEASAVSDRIWRTSQIDEKELPGLFFPSGASSFGPFTDPPFRYWNGARSGLSINGIEEHYPDEIVLTVGERSTEISDIDLFQDAAILEWDSQAGGPCDLILDGKAYKTGIQPEDSCHFALLVEALEPASRHEFTIRDASGYICCGEFQTRDTEQSGIARINSEHFSYRSDGFLNIGSRIPLRIDNAANEQVSWFADSRPVEAGPDGRITLDRSFTLKAAVSRGDGSQLIIIKEIKVK